MSRARPVYEERLKARQDAVALLDKRDVRVGNLRLFVALSAGLTAYLVLGPHLVPAWTLSVPALAFLLLVIWHEVLAQRRAAARLLVRFYERGLLRLDGRWHEEPHTGGRFLDAGHPYAGDLDLFGKGSLFQRLSLCNTAGGEEALAALLLERPTLSQARDRQAAVQELAPRVDLREDLSRLSRGLRVELTPALLVGWAGGAFVSQRVARIALFACLAIACVAGALAWGLFDTGPAWFFLAVILQWLGRRFLGRPLTTALAAVDEPARQFSIIAQLLHRLEREPVQARALVDLLRPLAGHAARRVAALARLVELKDSERNQIFAIIAWLLAWGPLLALAIEGWRQRHGKDVEAWLRAISTIEALTSLAGYAYEADGDVFPEIVEAGLVLEGVAHPLLPRAKAVENDVVLGETRLLLVSGSNMSGKSTLLRSVGVAVVLGLAGAPVRAKKARVPVLQVGASLRVVDSLQSGSSHFHAEIVRLKQLFDLAKESRLLFLLDEILHGTNSHDRKLGAAAVVRALVERSALGLVTTHDLALTDIVTELSGRAANVHFDDRLEGDRLVFDYRMKDGIVQRSNAIDLMRAVGLPV